jgi:hypothetical protein
MWKEIKEQYAYVWWWLLENGIVVSTIIVNAFLATIFAVVMSALYFFVRWYSKH